METAVVIQARLSSKRLPRKVLQRAMGKPLVQYVCERMQDVGLPTILAVPKGEANTFAFLQRTHSKPKLLLFEGPEDDVLGRYFGAAQAHNIRTIVRVTADNPFTSRACIKQLLALHTQAKADLSSFEGLPYGAGAEAIDASCLERMHSRAADPHERQHPTQFAYRNPNLFSIRKFPAPTNYRHPELRVTIDTPADWLRFEERLLRHSKNDEIVPLLEVVRRECPARKN